jgi:alkanesulfonate monooxygenase SsuD/methylene tetrahydromethanopterin reductase-like flavin-dependent oxidoreductase (luciferase family)
MKVGLFVNTQFPEGFNLKERVPEMVMQVRAARDAGFASLWFPHHWLTHPMQMLQITPVMAYVAAHAQGMTIGPNILILPPLNPVHVAEEAATLDVLTGGNYILGVGLGYRQPEFDAFGISLSERAPRFSESIALMRRLWSEERVSHKGRGRHPAPPRTSVVPATLLRRAQRARSRSLLRHAQRASWSRGSGSRVAIGRGVRVEGSGSKGPGRRGRGSPGRGRGRRAGSRAHGKG